MRIAVGLAMLILGLIVVLPNLTGYTSLDGIVNARIVVVAAPIEGTVLNTAPKSGEPLSESEHLLSIKNERVNRIALVELTAELKATQDRSKALLLQHGRLDALRSDLQQRLDSYRETTVRNLDREIAIQKERIGATESRAQERTSDRLRKEKLGATGHLSESELERTRVAEHAILHELDAAKAELARLEDQRDAARMGVFIGDGRNDVPYSLQRIDEITILLLEIATKRTEQEARLLKLQQQIADEERRINTQGFASLNSPFHGVMWRNNVVEGSNVVVGTELLSILDCHDLFVDIVVHEVNYDDIYPNREAEVRLFGRDQVFPGRVLSVRGSRADTVDKVSAATPDRVEGKYARIRVQLHPSALNTDYQNYCQVGRSVHVRFRRHSFPLTYWLRSLWFSIS